MSEPQHPDAEVSESSFVSDEVSVPKGRQPQSATTENQVVGKLKIVVWAAFALAAMGFGIATFILTRKEERGDFATRFDDLAQEIIRLSERELQSAFGATKNLGTTITSYGVDSGLAWPQVVVPHFELQGITLAELGRIQHFTIAPLVDVKQLEPWSDFTTENQDWIQSGLDVRFGKGAVTADGISREVYRMDGDLVVPQTGMGIDGFYAPVWQQYPAPAESSIVNFDLFSNPNFNEQFFNMGKSPVLSGMSALNFLLTNEIVGSSETPPQQAFLMQPLLSDFTNSTETKLVGFLVAVLLWKDILDHRIAEETISIVLHDTYTNNYLAFELSDTDITLIGDSDLHDSDFDHLMVSACLTSFLHENDIQQGEDHCLYELTLYPTTDFRDSFLSIKPLLYGVLAVLLFVLITVIFGAYDFVVQKKQHDVVAKAERTNKLISDLFPRNVKDRLLEEGYGNKVEQDLDGPLTQSRALVDSLHSRGRLNSDTIAQSKLKTVDPKAPYETKPIADLFPNATIMFGDLVGFTAWASVREPTQVFTLLETLYYAFDVLAKKRRVFKVETVGDCYVAAAGLPDPCPDHALVMARFAKDCMKKMRELSKQLEATLGPDTGDLSMRIGLHSGPVTAGVLRGEKSRFQLFGDTVNTAARIEATGQRNQIHMSQDTADLLKNAGKPHWLQERADTVTPKGKGEMQTFWLKSGDAREEKEDYDGEATVATPTPSDHDSYNHCDLADFGAEEEFEKLGLKDLGLDSEDFDERTQRLVRWNAEVLLKLLKQIVARRVAVEARNKETGVEADDNHDPVLWPKSALTPLEEVQEIIHMTEFDAFVAKHEPDPETIEIDEDVVGQLNDFVRIVASMYRSNPFHNFEHASHVAMSVSKLMSRIVAPNQLELGESACNAKESAKKSIKSSLHDFTFGITSDPLTQFACVFSALIHDVDHSGVPNTQLVKEKAYVARTYDNKSVAEQNSVDTAWDLLMDVNFRELRNTICISEDEQKRFRHLVVNSVLATDIVDKELKALRNARWERAFSDNVAGLRAGSERDQINRKATIVIEHLIQASDIAHTMQHWHIYRKWNERLYQELLLAYKKGRSNEDPSENWYKGELGFFDFYIIPLAKKLKNCGVFGVSCDEYLNYALRNRQEWERKGQEIVANMIKQHRDDIDSSNAVKLDGIQDSEGSVLRSSLMSSETLHEGSSHVTRAVLDLDTDAMTIDSTPNLVVSSYKSNDQSRSMDGSRSLTSSTETIFEDGEEDSSSTGEDFGGDDSFYAGRQSDDKSSFVDEVEGKVASPKHRANQEDHHINKTITTHAGHDLRGSKTKSLRGKTKGKSPRMFSTSDSFKGRSDTTCSTTQANTDWEHDSSSDQGLLGETDTMEPTGLYCLQQRINSRLVGSIKNTRAFDKKPSQEQMLFF